MTSPKDKKVSTTVHRSKKLSFSLFPPSLNCESDMKVVGGSSEPNAHQMMQQVVSDGTSNDKFAMGALLVGCAAVGLGLSAALSDKKRADDAVDMDRVEELIKIYRSGSCSESARAACSSRYTRAERKMASKEVENEKKKAMQEREAACKEAMEATIAEFKSRGYQLRKPPTES
ncbi:hypothetical protein [Aeromonas veronii]|uniref:hypothetical protein n=1 Tax=Aeromonas veronii TaxID=654 RepID=UPI003F74956E